MKRVEAVVEKDIANVICNALQDAGFPSFMSTSIRGRGRIHHGVYVNVEAIEEQILDKSKLEIILDEKDVDKVVSIIINNAKKGAVGDGKIFISEVKEVIRIRTGEKGTSAI